jgi:hypothetical protein
MLVSDRVWTVEEMCALLLGVQSATTRIDRRLILKAVLGEEVG